MNTVYRALSDPTRRTILKLLRQRDMTAGELSGHFPIAKPTLSKHFNVLKEADLIQGRRDGATITYTLNLSVLEDALCGLLNIFQINPSAGSALDLGADDVPASNGSPPTPEPKNKTQA